MMTRRWTLLASLLLSVAWLLSLPQPAAGLSKDLTEKLETAKYVYIASMRKHGELGQPAEIWFFYEGGALYVGATPDSRRVRRLKAGRPQAKVWIGEPNGPQRITVTEREIAMLPSFKARGEIVTDRKMQERLREVFAKKYAAEWPEAEDLFHFENGKRVLVKYVPVD
jgi:hypothetical protein